MAEALRDLLIASDEARREQGDEGDSQPLQIDSHGLEYLTHLTQLPLESLKYDEAQKLSASSHSTLLAIQALSKKSYKPIVESAACHDSFRRTLPVLSRRAHELTQAVPKLDSQAEHFSTAFSKSSDNSLLRKRREALRLLQNSERLVDVMDLPPLLQSSVVANPVNYSATLDLYAHVRHLSSLYPDSPLLKSIVTDADASLRQLASSLITALQASTLKLASAVRTIGWLRRTLPDLVSTASTDEVLPALFLVCRFITLLTKLQALDPLRQLAEVERSQQKEESSHSWSGGQQTERYLKRYIEIFREHSFHIISIYNSVNASSSASNTKANTEDDPLGPLPSALSTLPLHLTEMLMDVLHIYLPVVKDRSSRESILTQVLYCAGSMGRLGADFGMLLSSIGAGEWVDLVKRHRLLAGRLESVIGEVRDQPQGAVKT